MYLSLHRGFLRQGANVVFVFVRIISNNEGALLGRVVEASHTAC
jgi:hypothetical protein